MQRLGYSANMREFADLYMLHIMEEEIEEEEKNVGEVQDPDAGFGFGFGGGS